MISIKLNGQITVFQMTFIKFYIISAWECKIQLQLWLARVKNMFKLLSICSGLHIAKERRPSTYRSWNHNVNCKRSHTIYKLIYFHLSGKFHHWRLELVYMVSSKFEICEICEVLLKSNSKHFIFSPCKCIGVFLWYAPGTQDHQNKSLVLW